MLMGQIVDKFGNFVALILLVVACFLFGVPLTARLCKILKRTKNGSSPVSRATVASLHDRRMSPRRQDSQETLIDGSANVRDVKLDGSKSPLFLRPDLR
jgi:hypothetical protein